jgi:hypothetical protein
MTSRNNSNGNLGRSEGSSGNHHFHPLFSRALSGAQGIQRAPLSPVTGASTRPSQTSSRLPPSRTQNLESKSRLESTNHNSSSQSNNVQIKKNIQIKGTSTSRPVLEPTSRITSENTKAASPTHSTNNPISIKGLATRETRYTNQSNGYSIASNRRSSSDEIPEEGLFTKRLREDRAEQNQRFENSKRVRRGSREYPRNQYARNDIELTTKSSTYNNNKSISTQDHNSHNNNLQQNTPVNSDSPKLQTSHSSSQSNYNNYNQNNSVYYNNNTNAYNQAQNNYADANNTANQNAAYYYPGQFYPPHLTSGIRCRFFPGCRMSDKCKFYHPTEVCEKYPDCPLQDNVCNYIHPISEKPKFNGERASKIPCRYGKDCHTIGCAFQHTADMEPTWCRYGKLCQNKTCKYLHDPNYIPPFVVKRMLSLDPATKLPFLIVDDLTKRYKQFANIWRHNAQVNSQRANSTTSDHLTPEFDEFEVQISQELPKKGSKATITTQIIQPYPVPAQ